MGSDPTGPAFVSVVVTVKNESRHLRHLFESLRGQEAPFEVVLVDALSRDGTFEIAKEYERNFPGMFRAFQRYGSRGIGRNVGVHEARGEFVAFIDGDCFADSRWLHQLRGGFQSVDVVAGKTVNVGQGKYAELERVELFERGSDVTFPSCNLGYRKALFDRLGGFDPRFITAEDIDLNLRAVQSGATVLSVPEAVVYHQVRATFVRFLYQAFWNGYGRKQLTEKHGNLWGAYRLRRLLAGQKGPIAWARLCAALFGYVSRVFTGGGHRLSTPRRS
ncbi:MAG: glycosyltransferase [Candidatus Lutacidiplasmatales archaeon]